MNKSIVARLRERIETRVRNDLDEVRLHIDTLSELLDIVEAMAAREPVDWYGERACLYCRVNIGDGDDHAPNCPYIRAREMCGKGDD